MTQPQINWPGLLKWSTSYSGIHSKSLPNHFPQKDLLPDGTREARPITPERRRFLERAFQEAFEQFKDPSDLVKEAVVKLSNPDTSVTTSSGQLVCADGDALSALKLIEKCVDEAPEISRNLERLGALQILIEILRREQSVDGDSLEQREAKLQLIYQILSFALPNNPEVQSAAHRLGLGALLCQNKRTLLSNSTCFGVLSGFVRHNPPAAKVSAEGTEALYKILQIFMQEILSDFSWAENLWASALATSSPKVAQKAASLLRYLVEEGFWTVENLNSPTLLESLSAALPPYAPKCEQKGIGLQYYELLLQCGSKVWEKLLNQKETVDAEAFAQAKNNYITHLSQLITSLDDAPEEWESVRSLAVALKRALSF